MARRSAYNLPPGIQLDQHGTYWATLEGDDAKLWRERYPERTLPRRKAKTYTEAIRLQRQLVDDLKATRDPNAENSTIAHWVETGINRKRKLAPSTIRRYRQLLTWQIKPHRIAKLRLQQAMKRHVEDWIDALIAQKRQPPKTRPDDDMPALDPYTIERAFGLLRMAFNMAIAEGLLARNPCTRVELPQPDDEEIRPLDPEQVDTLLIFLDTYVLDKATGQRRPHRNAALYHVAIRCGLRLGWLIGLRWIDIDLDRGELRVVGQLQKGKRRRTKTGDRGRRTLPLSRDVVRVLRWHKRNQVEEQAIAPEGWNAAGLVFCSEHGTPMSDRNLERQFDAFLKAAKLPDIRFHDMRHTYAALSIAAGVDIYTLSRRMGHSSIRVTADRYGHLYAGQSDDADALDRLLKRSA
jgi:site-specific recombinase XerD